MWKDIPGYKFRYRINDEGTVQKLDGEKWITLKPMLSSARAEVGMRRIDGSRYKASVARLVANAFFGGHAEGKSIIHLNGAKMDNSISNLKIVSKSEASRLSGGPKRKAVEMIDRDGNVVELYRSQAAAAKANYISKNSVSARCRNRLKDPYHLTGYTFRYEKVSSR